MLFQPAAAQLENSLHSLVFGLVLVSASPTPPPLILLRICDVRQKPSMRPGPFEGCPNILAAALFNAPGYMLMNTAV
eukprot:4412224-Pyramimonas_sp.AAC.1